MSIPTVLCLMGPTASGKTALAMQLAEQRPCRLISVDSALIYRGMDIGTGKPTAAELARHPHELIDICDPAESYSAARFRIDALAAIERALAAGQLPVLVGGTMLYFKALIEGLAELPDADPALRAELEQQREMQGLAALHARLAERDPESARRIHANDPQRILRALEVVLRTGRPMHELWQAAQATRPPWRFVQVGLLPERAWLHERIARRFDAMLIQGFVDEVKALKSRKDLHADLPSIRCVGYRQIWEWLDGACPENELRERCLAATRQLAKRQYTWARSWPLDLRLTEKELNPVPAVLKALASGPI